MTNHNVKTVNEFIKESAKDARPHLKELQALIQATVKGVEETISYGKPYYKLNGHLVGFDAYKQHIGFEIYEGQLDEEHRSKLEEKGYKTGSKGFQISFDQKVPVAIVKKVVKRQVSVNKNK
jgi:uncharacterized protein YdhG (YjbR/CyaY superfamily)